jgi:hypothetical protein
MKESDILLSRAEKLRRDARCVRKEATRLSLASDQRRMMDVAHRLEADARDLEGRARQRTGKLETSALRQVPQPKLPPLRPARTPPVHFDTSD